MKSCVSLRFPLSARLVDLRGIYLGSRYLHTNMATSERRSDLAANYDSIIKQVNETASGKQVKLVAVSKYKPVEDLQALYDHGVRDFGENYVQELLTKAETLPKDIRWHFIGGLQSGKCKDLSNNITNLYAVHSIDSFKKVKKMNSTRKAAEGNPVNIFLQINTSGESQKSGYSLGDQKELHESIDYILNNKECDKLNLLGLMTIGSFAESVAGVENKDFRALTDLKKELDAKYNIDLELSMGMSNDFIEAIRQGSSVVRVGSSIFGARPVKP